MNNDPKDLQPSPDGKQQPQQPLLHESQPPDGQLPYGGSPIPTSWPPQPPKKPSRRWLWITLALLGGLVALTCIGITIFVAVSVGSFAKLARPSLRSRLLVLLVVPPRTTTITHQRRFRPKTLTNLHYTFRDRVTHSLVPLTPPPAI